MFLVSDILIYPFLFQVCKQKSSLLYVKMVRMIGRQMRKRAKQSYFKYMKIESRMQILCGYCEVGDTVDIV